MPKPTLTSDVDHSTILLVDDEPAFRASLAQALDLERFDVEQAASGSECLSKIRDTSFDAVILDVSMPGGIDGLEVARRLRSSGNTIPILMLTARDAVDDRVAGLDAGADDYLVKPFALRELTARLRALLRRTDTNETETLGYAGLVLDKESRRFEYEGRQIELSRTEFSLMALFLEHPKRVMSRSQIFEAVWDYDFGPTSNALGVYIGYLRRKLETVGAPDLIKTVRGVGYVLREQ